MRLPAPPKRAKQLQRRLRLLNRVLAGAMPAPRDEPASRCCGAQISTHPNFCCSRKVNEVIALRGIVIVGCE